MPLGKRKRRLGKTYSWREERTLPSFIQTNIRGIHGYITRMEIWYCFMLLVIQCIIVVYLFNQFQWVEILITYTFTISSENRNKSFKNCCIQISYISVYPEMPDSFCENKRKAQLRRIIDLQQDPVFGICSQWDYEKDNWKKYSWI